MKIYMPTLVYSERDVVRKHAAEMASFGTKAMIVTGKHSSRINGSLEDVMSALADQGVPYVIYDDIPENPPVETVAAAAQTALAEKVDFFIGVGGGSPMDAAKAISVLTRNPEFIPEAEKQLYTPFDVEFYPVVCVPTTCGTGSEVTQYAVLTRHSNKSKQGMLHPVFAELALVDAHYLRTASYAGMVSTCTDALAHLIESYLSTKADDYNRIYAKEGLAVWGQGKEKLRTEASFKAMTDEDLETFMHASVLAGMAIAQGSTTLPHGLSYPVTYEMHVSHGKAVGIFLPGFLENYPDQSMVQTVLGLLGFKGLEDFSDYLQDILGTVEIPAALWDRDVNKEIMCNPAKLANYPYEMTHEILRKYAAGYGEKTIRII